MVPAIGLWWVLSSFAAGATAEAVPGKAVQAAAQQAVTQPVRPEPVSPAPVSPAPEPPTREPVAASASASDVTPVTNAERNFWSFRPLQRSSPPQVRDAAWCRTDIDRFVLTRLEAASLAPNPPSDRRTLIRRVYFDLVGLPPNPAEVEQFVADRDPQAYERLIDRLLSSRHYGERWARYWLDVARFAESSGFEHDDDRPYAYHYRDFVIRAFNQDLPFDEFIRWQLAGDELAPDNPWALVATGFLGAGTFPTQLTETEFESARYDELDDMVNHTGLAFLGLSLGCARCHDHKFDPIPAGDYYAMAAVFAETVRSELDLVFEPAAPAVKAQVTADGFPPMKNHADGRGYPYFYSDVYLLRRGDVTQKVKAAEPGFVQVLMGNGCDSSSWTQLPPAGWQRSKFRRSALAAWITDAEHGAGHLAARVMANRIWQHHFDRGLVTTPNDFGMQGERPTHPELLDWLAQQLIANHWSVKHLHRLIMTSSVYLQNDAYDELRAARDRDNSLYWRRTPRRLDAEAIRDALLVASGEWDPTMYGPGSLDEAMRRRSIYFTIKRSKLIPTMMLFDWPEHLVSIGQRPTTTAAPQALLFLNNLHVRSWASGFARRIAPDVGAAASGEVDEYSQAIRSAYAIALGRPPTPDEAKLTAAFLQQQYLLHRAAESATESATASATESATASATASVTARQAALTDFAQMILSSNEFLFIR